MTKNPNSLNDYLALSEEEKMNLWKQYDNNFINISKLKCTCCWEIVKGDIVNLSNCLLHNNPVGPSGKEGNNAGTDKL